MRQTLAEVAEAFISSYGLFQALQQAKQIKTLYIHSPEEIKYWDDVIIEIEKQNIK
jgi:hypothetical protein